MPNNYFRFKQFSINQDKCAMKVGTDGILLGAWTNCEGAARILDVGTGTGLLALMIAQKCNAFIDAVEIDPVACVQATDNVALSPWKERIKIIHSSFQNYSTESVKYDLIVTNPPYFTGSLKAPDLARTAARHNDTLSPGDILQGSSIMLSEGGKLALILPYEEGSVFIAMAVSFGLFCLRKTNVISVPGKPVKRLLLEFSGKKTVYAEDDLVISPGTRHKYTEKYKNLTGSYYLYFRSQNS
ncbi:MAG: methyltransferase [Bacteroidia bacterium]|nr:methyltransferase [Bacteroidia bacterium]